MNTRITVGLVFISLGVTLFFFPLFNLPFFKANTVVQNTSSNTFTLAVGQTGKVGDLTIKLNSAKEDSRCGVDVVCIQAGYVKIGLDIRDGNTKETKNILSNTSPFEFGKYTISVVDIMPIKYSGVEIGEKDYRVTFRVN